MSEPTAETGTGETGTDEIGVRPVRGRRWRWAAAGAVLVLAAGFTGWSAWSWWDASHDGSTALATDRDAVLQAGRAEITALDSMDYRNPDAGLNRWLAASTGALHDELQRTTTQSRQQIVTGRTTAAGQVLDAAVTELDTTAGTAQLIASVQIVLTPAGGSATTERNRYQAGLTRTSAGWKLSSLTAIPAGTR